LKIPDPERFYPLDEAESIVKLFGVLFSQETLKDWIIIPGTILGSFENNSPITKNQAYVIKGGEKDPKKAILTKHTKLNTPGGDGVPERSRFTIKPPKGDLTPQKEYEINWMAKVRTNIIDLGGFTLGIDLCMDHGARVLYRTCKRWAGKDDKALGVHLQLLVACGHLLKPESIATFKGGILLRVEGASTQTPYSQALKVTKTDWDDYALSDFERHDPDAPYLSPKEVPRRSQPTIKVKAQKAYNYTECLRVYTATVIPVKEAEKVQAP